MNNFEKNVLVFPGGSEIGLEIFHSLKHCKEVNVFSANSDVSNHSSFVFKNHNVVANVNQDGWIVELNNVIVRNKIDHIFPANDDVIMALARNDIKINAEIISSPYKTCLICRSKKKTYDFFRGIIPVPFVYNTGKNISFPVFVKPDIGQGSKDAYKISNDDELNYVRKKVKDLVVMEFLPGVEFTVDCFSDRDNGLLFCSGRERVRTKSGISMNSRIVDEGLNSVFKNFAMSISKKLDIYGAWFFQLKKDVNNQFKLLEVAPRISGTMAINRVLGVNFPLLSIYEANRKNIEIITNKNNVEIDRALTNRFKHNISYDTVYVDLDDTLIFKDSINTTLIRFLFQSLNSGKKLVLITRTKNNLVVTLKRWRIENLFDKIILIEDGELKSKFISDENAIFIDDSFHERKEVYCNKKIPTFDLSMIELLVDERF